MEVKEKKVDDDYRGVFVVNSLILGDGSRVGRAVCRPCEIEVFTAPAGIDYRLVKYRMIYWDEQPADAEAMEKSKVYFAPVTRTEANRRIVASVETKSTFWLRINREDFQIEEIEAMVIDDFLDNVIGAGQVTRLVAPTLNSLRVHKRKIVKTQVGEKNIGIWDVLHTWRLGCAVGQSLKVTKDEVTYKTLDANGRPVEEDKSFDYHPSVTEDLYKLCAQYQATL